MSLAARWEHPGPPISKNQVWPVWRRLVRSSDRWVPLSDYPDGFRDALADPKGKPAFPVASAEQAGRLVPPELCGVGWGQPGVVIRVPLANRAEDDLGIEVPERQSFSATWGRYFPTIPVSERETFAYPNPGEVAFWRLYAEPVDDFLATARRVRDAVRALDEVWFPERPDDETVLESRFLEGQGLNRLHMLSGPMKLALAFDPLTSPIEPALLPAAKDCYQQVWVSPSLLCSVALMALLDRVGSSARCKRCGKEIVPGRAIGRYCSRKCYEAGKKAELRRSKAGRPFPVIADRTKRQRSPPSES